ncbi:MAG TPA: hypothetical protein VFK94_06335 [Patescibacteria group bacterium]|nr:hypothetical protein [Patescibacteria group bacterium]
MANFKSLKGIDLKWWQIGAVAVVSYFLAQITGYNEFTIVGQAFNTLWMITAGLAIVALLRDIFRAVFRKS